MPDMEATAGTVAIAGTEVMEGLAATDMVEDLVPVWVYVLGWAWAWGR